jgi:hypothetical protein
VLAPLGIGRIGAADVGTLAADHVLALDAEEAHELVRNVTEAQIGGHLPPPIRRDRGDVGDARPLFGELATQRRDLVRQRRRVGASLRLFLRCVGHARYSLVHRVASRRFASGWSRRGAVTRTAGENMPMDRNGKSAVLRAWPRGRKSSLAHACVQRWRAGDRL